LGDRGCTPGDDGARGRLVRVVVVRVVVVRLALARRARLARARALASPPLQTGRGKLVSRE